MASAGGSSRSATSLILFAGFAGFAGFEGTGESRDASYLAETDWRLVTQPAVSSVNDFDGGCNAVTGAGGCTCGAGVFGAPILG